MTSIDELDFRYNDSERIRTAADVELYYEQRGNGPDLVVTNNFFMISPAWRSFTARLESTSRILSYDFRNQGASTSGRADPTWADHLDDLARLLDAREIDSAYLLGTSISALLCRDFALARPDRVRGLVFAGPAISPWGKRRFRRVIKSWLKTLDHLGMQALFDQIYPLVFGDKMIEDNGTPGYLALRESFLVLHSQEQIKSSLTVSLSVDSDPKLLTELAMPVLLVLGDDDFGWSASAAEEMLRLVPDGRCTVLPRAGHLPFLEATEGFERAVAEFIAETEAGRG